MFVRKLYGGGEIRARCFGNGWTLTAINANGKGVAVGLTLTEGGALARLLTFEDDTGFSKQDTGVIDVSDLDGQQHEEEDTP